MRLRRADEGPARSDADPLLPAHSTVLCLGGVRGEDEAIQAGERRGREGRSDVTEPIDILNDLLAEAEEVLSGLRLGVSARVALGEHSLVCAKRGPAWGLIVEFASGDEKPILTASKAHRIEAAFKLGELYEALRRAAEAADERTMGAIDAAEAFVARVREASGADAEGTTA